MCLTCLPGDFWVSHRFFCTFLPTVDLLETHGADPSKFPWLCSHASRNSSVCLWIKLLLVKIGLIHRDFPFETCKLVQGLLTLVCLVCLRSASSRILLPLHPPLCIGTLASLTVVVLKVGKRHRRPGAWNETLSLVKEDFTRISHLYLCLKLHHVRAPSLHTLLRGHNSSQRAGCHARQGVL